MQPPAIAISPTELVRYRAAARDYAETERLKAELFALRAARAPFFLGIAELEPIFAWKLERQYGRNRHQRDRNTEAEYRAITQATFTAVRTDPSEEAAKRLQILMCLDGVGIGVASAILALTEPTRCCVIDFRGCRALYASEKRSFTVRDYRAYRSDVDKLARSLGWSVQETDLALWTYDEDKNRKANKSLETNRR